MKTQLKLLSALAASVVLSLSASAIEISYSDYGVGEWTPASEFNNNAGVLKGVVHSVDVWNGDAAAGLYTEGMDSATFTKGSGAELDAMLSVPDTYVDRVEEIDFDLWAGLDNTAGLYSYITAKYGNGTQRVYYIGDVLDVITVDTSLGQGGGLSHVSWLSGGATSVPDGGMTLVLLGVGLSGLAYVSRFQKRNS